MMHIKTILLLSLAVICSGGNNLRRKDGASSRSANDRGVRGADAQGGNARGTNAQGGNAQGGNAWVRTARGVGARGVSAQGGAAQGGHAWGNSAQGGDAIGGDVIWSNYPSGQPNKDNSTSEEASSLVSSEVNFDEEPNEPTEPLNEDGASSQGANAQGGDAQGGNAHGGDAQGGDAQGGDGQGADAIVCGESSRRQNVYVPISQEDNNEVEEEKDNDKEVIDPEGWTFTNARNKIYHFTNHGLKGDIIKHEVEGKIITFNYTKNILLVNDIQIEGVTATERPIKIKWGEGRPQVNGIPQLSFGSIGLGTIGRGRKS